MVSCSICDGQFGDSPDSIVLCEHKGGAVHLGCCENNCSGDNKPCEHALATYSKNIE